MKTKRILWVILSLLVVGSMLFTACQPQPAEEEEIEEPIAAEESEEEAEEETEESGLPNLGGQEITIAVENAYLPFNYIDPATGEPAGWDYDVWNEICDLLNCTPKYVEAAWEGMIQAIADDQFDAAGDGITITDERAEVVDFSVGYINIQQRLLVREDEDRFESIEDIVANEEFNLGTQTGTTNYETANQYLPEERIQAFEQFPFAVQALIAGDIDAVIIDEVAGQGYLGENAELLKLVGPSMSSDQLGFIFPKGSDLVEPVNEAIKTLAGNGFLDEINAKYFGPDFNITYDDLFPPEEEEGEETEEVGLTCDEPIKVGLMTDATGPLAIYGAHIIRSFMLGMEHAAGAPGSVGDVFTVEDGRNTFMIDDCEIEIILGDDQTNVDLLTSKAQEFIEVEKVDVLVGSVSSGVTATLQEMAAENKIPLIIAPAAANDLTGTTFNEYTFRTSRENYQDAMTLCKHITEKYDTFAQIAPDYSFGWGGAAAYRDACKLYGGTFPIDDIFAPADTTDFTPYMEQILDSGAEAWIPTWAGGGFIAIMQSAVDLGVVDEMDMASSFVDNVALPAFFANSIGSTGSILYHYSAPDNELNDWFVEETKARYEVYPDLFDADGANAAIMLVEGLKKTGGDTDADALIAAWEGMEFEGPKGTVYIRPEDHVAIQDMYVMKLLNVDDPDAMFFELLDTIRPEPPCLLPEDLQDRCGDLPIGSLTGE